MMVSLMQHSLRMIQPTTFAEISGNKSEKDKAVFEDIEGMLIYHIRKQWICICSNYVILPWWCRLQCILQEKADCRKEREKTEDYEEKTQKRIEKKFFSFL